jgi:hypothetical protein
MRCPDSTSIFGAELRWGRAAAPARLHDVVRTPIDVTRTPRRRPSPVASTYAVEIEISGFLVRVQTDVDVRLLADIVKTLRTLV